MPKIKKESMKDSLEKSMIKAAKAGNVESMAEISKILKPLLRYGKSGDGHIARMTEQAQYAEGVRQNKILAAELRKMNKSFPNIAVFVVN